MDLTQIKLFLRVDTEEDDEIIKMQLKAAQSYLKGAGVNPEKIQEGTDDFELYKLAQYMLVCHWYENRNTVLIGSISKTLEYSIASIVCQLRS